MKTLTIAALAASTLVMAACGNPVSPAQASKESALHTACLDAQDKVADALETGTATDALRASTASSRACGEYSDAVMARVQS